jgi:hypothetical protein
MNSLFVEIELSFVGNDVWKLFFKVHNERLRCDNFKGLFSLDTLEQVLLKLADAYFAIYYLLSIRKEWMKCNWEQRILFTVWIKKLIKKLLQNLLPKNFYFKLKSTFFFEETLNFESTVVRDKEDNNKRNKLTSISLNVIFILANKQID